MIGPPATLYYTHPATRRQNDMTDTAFRDHNAVKIVHVRVHRKSDQHYWTCTIRAYPTQVMGAIQQVQAWAAGLAVHPNFECVTFESLDQAANRSDDFDQLITHVRTFLDGSSN